MEPNGLVPAVADPEAFAKVVEDVKAAALADLAKTREIRPAPCECGVFLIECAPVGKAMGNGRFFMRGAP